MKIFLHGVPDSPNIWQPLLQALNLPADQFVAPALPGFVDDLPNEFPATKEAYVAWMIYEMEKLAVQHGPLDVIGHDWGAIIIQRAAMLRPDLVRSWVVINAVIEPQYRGHRLARIWSTPILGEIFMALASGKALARHLVKAGMPKALADEAALQWESADKRKAILKLYRSAAGLSFKEGWAKDIHFLPKNAALIWGENDPYVPLAVAQRYAEANDAALHIMKGAGHWALAEQPHEIAQKLEYFWTSFHL